MYAPRTIALGQTLDLPDGTFTLASYGHGAYRLRDDLTGQYHLVHHAELSRMLPSGIQIEYAEEAEKSKLTLDATIEGLDQALVALVPHLQELIDGTPAVGDTPRPQYSPDLPLEGKYYEKLKELKAEGVVISLGTLKRRVSRFRQAGIESLRDQRKARTPKPLHKANEDVLKALKTLLASYAGKSSPSYTRIRGELHRALIEAFPDAETRPKLPSLKTVERYVTQIMGKRNPTKPARGLETAALAPSRQFRPRQVSAPGDECQVDSTTFDALVRLPNGKIGRPTLTILTDKRTKSIVAHNFTAAAPTGYDHSVMLAKALVPRPLRSWAKQYDDFGLPVMEWSKHLTSEQLRTFDTHKPYIFPRRIVIDNGADYRGVVFRLACERFGIHLTEAPPHSPTTKAGVERTFGSIRSLFTQYLPGYTHSNTESRGSKVAEEEVLDLAVVDDLFERWVAIVYQNRQHDGLVDILDPQRRHTPNSSFAASIEMHGHFVMAYEEQDFIALMPSVARTVQSNGVEFNGRRYDSPHLAPMRGRKSREGVTAQVNVHYDPSDLHRVWIRSDDGEWITCSWNEQEGLSRPLERQYTELAHIMSSRMASYTNDQAVDIVLELRDQLAAEDAENKRAARVAEKAAKKAAARRPKPVEEVLANPVEDEDDDFNDIIELAVR